MKISAKLPSVLAVLIMLLAIFYAQTKSINSDQHEVTLEKSITIKGS